MDGYTFTADLIKSLAWPAAAVIMAFVFRQPLTQLIPLLETLKYKDWEAKFSKKEISAALNKAEKQAAKVPLDLQPVASDETEVAKQPAPSALDAAQLIYKRYADLWAISPEAAMLDAWTKFEQAVWDAARRLGIPIPVQRNVRILIDKFHELRWLARGQVRLIQSLNHLRNLAAHRVAERSFSAGDAERFVSLVVPVTNYFAALTPKSPKVPDTD